MKTALKHIKHFGAGAVAIGGCAGTRLGIEWWADTERSMMFACAALTLTGTVLGMLGSSNLFWSADGKRKMVARASAGDKAAIASLRKREDRRDTLGLYGWAFVFAGAGLLFLWYFFHG